MDEGGLLSRVPKLVLYALGALSGAVAFAGLLVSFALREGGALLMALPPLIWLCLFRIELRDRARRRKLAGM